MPTLAIDINIITHELQKGKKYFRKAVRVMAKKTVDAAAMIAKGLWNEPIKDGEKIRTCQGCVGPTNEIIPRMYEGLYYAYIEYTKADADSNYELILC